MKEKKKKEATLRKPGGNKLLRRVILILALGFLGAFLFFVYLFINDTRRDNLSRDAIHEQISLISEMDSHYFAMQRHESKQDAAELVKDTKRFGELIATMREGRQGLPVPSATQLALIKKISGKWQSIRPFFDSAISGQAVVASLQTSVPTISALASDVKLSATRMRDNLSNSSIASRARKNLNNLIKLANQLDKVAAGFLSKNTPVSTATQGLSQYIASIDSHIVAITKDINKVGGAAAFNSQVGSEAFAMLKEKDQALRAALAAISGNASQISATGKVTDLSTYQSELLVLLRELKDTYDGSSSHPVEGIPLSSLVWTIICLTLTVLLIGTWAIMLLVDGKRLNKETTRLRVAAEERTKNDQEAILRLMDELADLSEGDLTIEAQVTEDFTGAIADSINFTVENMRDMVGTITHTSEEITRATAISQDVSRLLTDSSTEQSHQIDASTETVQHMATSLYGIAENTNASVEIARSSVDMAQEGRNRVRSTIKSMSDIRENIQETAKRIKRLGESSQEIGDIVEIIKGIADQTNVLALNAAIQATAAGEAGRGFAVVADEVQRLAERSANATKRIEVLVKTIQADANEAVSSMENSTKQVVTGTEVAEEAGQSLDQIETVSKNLASLIVNVSQATRDAAGMAGDVATSMGLLADLNEKAVQDVTTSVRSVNDLRELSASLKDSVAGFKLP